MAARSLKKEVLPVIRGLKKFSFLMTDKASVKNMYLENCIYEKKSKNVKRLEIGKDIRGVIFKKVTNQTITTHS